MSRKITTKEFIVKAKEVHGDKYDYSATVYSGSNDKLKITCPHHGEFTQVARIHLKGSQCPNCAHHQRRITKGSTLDHFLDRATKAHGNRFDYSRVTYVNAHTPVTIICKEHGEFVQSPHNHVKGLVGCTECNGQSNITKEELITASLKIFGEGIIDYTLLPQKLSHHTIVKFRCIKHDQVFSQEVSSHLRGSVTCHICNKYSRLTEEKATRVSLSLYPDKKFDFSHTRYDIGSTAINTIGCYNKDHGFFQQSLSGHFSGKTGCKKCSQGNGTSAMEKTLANHIEHWGISILRNPRHIIPPHEVDIFIPTHNIAIEFNGLYWHSEKSGKNRNYHYDKWRKCQDKGVQLITIWEDEWVHKHDIVLSMLQHKLGVATTDKVYARKTNVKTVPTPQAHTFLDAHHIQGSTGGTLHLGLYTQTHLIGVSTWRKHKNTLYLDRYATSCTIPGGLGKLLKVATQWAQDNNCTEIVTFSNHEVSNGHLYDVLGFTRDKELPPDYTYLTPHNTRAHKFSYRKKRFKNDPDLFFDETLTETELAKINGFTRIWDCGKTRFILPV